MRALRFYSRPARLEKEGALGYPALMQAVLALVVGFVGGTLGGLIGLGGGFIMVPLLIYLFHMSQHDAQGTSLAVRSEEHTYELQSPCNLVCRLLLEKKKRKAN